MQAVDAVAADMADMLNCFHRVDVREVCAYDWERGGIMLPSDDTDPCYPDLHFPERFAQPQPYVCASTGFKDDHHWCV